MVNRKETKKRAGRGGTDVAKWCQEHRHEPVDKQLKTLNAKLRGHYQYYGRPTNSRSLWQFYRAVRKIWRKWLSRRTRGKELTREKYTEFLLHHPLLLPWLTRSWDGAGRSALGTRSLQSPT